jgi:galactokinase
MTKEEISAGFEKIFRYKPQAGFFAPGRVNLIGEHIDYNGGHVFPCALSMGTYAAAAKRSDYKIRLYSANFPQTGIIEVYARDVKYQKEDNWANYPKGVVSVFGQAGYRINSGFDVFYKGDIPNGAGLSSSASIEVCTGVMLNGLYDFNLDNVSIAKLAQKAENEFVGMNCGIMDQFASANGKKDGALLLNCDTLEYKCVPLSLGDCSIVIINTDKRRELAGSKYNERRAQCEAALKDLKTEVGVKDLCSLTPQEFEKRKGLIKDPVSAKRARHAVYENARTVAAAELLQKDDLSGFGKLMTESHNSLRDDYEVSCKELDTAVDLAMKQKGALGARMTGAGFGGCAVCLVKSDGLKSFTENVGRDYKKITGLDAGFYVTGAGAGAGKIELTEK